MQNQTNRTEALPRPLPFVIYVLTAGTFLMGTSEFIVAGLLPEIAADFGVSVADVGFAITLFAIGMIFGAPATALLTLRIPKRLTLCCALAVFSVGHLTAAMTTSFELMLASRFLSAVATGAFWGSAAVVATSAAGPGAGGRALGIVIGGGMLANILGFPLGSIARQITGWRGPFWALCVVAAITALLIFRKVPEDSAADDEVSLRRELAGLRLARLWYVLIACVTVNAGVLSVYSFIAPLLTKMAGLPAWSVPASLALFGLASLVGSVMGGRIGDRHPLTFPLITAGISALASAGVLVCAQMPFGLLGFFTLLGLVGLAANPVLTNLAVGYGGRAPTLASSLVISFLNVGTALGTWVTGLLLGMPIGVLAPAWVGVVFALLTLIPIGMLLATERRGTVTGSAEHTITG